MKTIYDIARAELKIMFYSPIAWLIIIIFTVQVALRFTSTFGGLVWNESMNLGLPAGLTEHLFVSPFGGLYLTVLNYLYLYIPLLTMGLVSRELGSGTIKMLYSSPVTNTQIILGKFFAMMIFGIILVIIISLFIAFATINVKDFDLAPTLTGLLGIYLLICLYSAVGIFMSSLTSYQVVAAISTLFVLGTLNFVKGLWQHIDFIRDITWWLSMSGRVNELIKGLICSEDIIYFLIVTALFLVFAIIRLQAKRQKASWCITWSKYAGTFVLVALIGYATSRPKTMFFYDTTATKHNSLTQSSQEIISQLEGKLKVTTYINILDPNFGFLFPRDKNTDLQRFRHYTRFKPEMEFEYVYYYDQSPDPSIESRYPGMTDHQRMIDIAKTYREDTNRFLPPQKIRALIDLSGEHNRLTRIIEWENGNKAILRTFNDVMKFPSESEISASLKHLITKMPLVGFVTGHGERNYLGENARDYSLFTDNRPFRNALVNQGFDFTEVNLREKVSSKVDILVLADLRHPLSPEEFAHYKEYTERGGNVLIAGEVNRQKTMNPLVKMFGVTFMPGQLVRPSQLSSPDLILSKITQDAPKIAPSFIHGIPVTMPGCLGLTYTPDLDYQMIPITVTDNNEVWNETETTDFIEDKPELNPEKGEHQQVYPTTLALTKPVGGKEQRIIILGDADCFSNDELGRARKNIDAYNFSLIYASFNWLSYNKAPIDTSRPSKTDNKIYIQEQGMKIARIGFVWCLPSILLLTALIIGIRRRKR